jgi:hypothetical protein
LILLREIGKREANFLNMAVFPLKKAFIACKRRLGKGAAHIKIINKFKIMKKLPKWNLWQKNCIKYYKIL